MAIKEITEEMNIHKEWETRAESIKSPEDLALFVGELINDYQHDYGTIVHACMAAMSAAFSVIDSSPQGDITGFQAGCLMWECVKKFGMEKKDAPLRMTNFSNMLYPQYRNRFTTIPRQYWERIQREAVKILAKGGPIHADVEKHMREVVAGKVPFGYSIAEE